MFSEKTACATVDALANLVEELGAIRHKRIAVKLSGSQ